MPDISFSERTSAQRVAERLDKHAAGPLQAFMVPFIEHLHKLIRETRPSQADWRRAMEFLTDVGHASDGRRQEWVLLSDLLGVTPTGPKSFALADCAGTIRDVRVAQFAAGLDPLDDVEWLKNLKAPHHVFEMPRKLHDMGGAGDEFLAKLDEAMRWTLDRDTP